MRIFETGLYLVTRQERIVFDDASRGFAPVQYVMSGAKYRRVRETTDDARPFNPNNDGRYALMDGHLPEYQPVVDGAGVEMAILADRWLAARVLPPEPEAVRYAEAHAWPSRPLGVLRHYVTGAIERGESQPIEEIRASAKGGAA